ncbi:SH3 domain-containing protein [Leptospira sp. 96542]|nr:SH3 domain-containing protein [Leptospira sp. 96542]
MNPIVVLSTDVGKKKTTPMEKRSTKVFKFPNFRTMSFKQVLIGVFVSFQFSFLPLLAQSHWDDYIPEKTPNSTYNLFGENVNLRSEANTNSKIVTKLSIGDKIQIVQKTEEKFSQNGTTEYWYKIKFGKETGFVWGGLIADYTVTLGDKKLLCRNKGPKLTGVELKLIQGNKILSNETLETGAVGNEAWGFILYPTKGFSPEPTYIIGLQHFVFSELEYGYKNEMILTIDKKNKLDSHFNWIAAACDPPSCMESWLVFPNKPLLGDKKISLKPKEGKKNSIIQISRSYDIDDPSVNDYTEDVYIWNGSKFLNKESNK